MKMENKEEEKRERPEGTIMQIAACPFCGQTRIREGVAVEVSEDELVEYAKLHCDCDAAKAYQGRKARLEKAKRQIIRWFEDEDQEFIEIAVELAHLVQRGKVDNATIVNDCGKKIKIGTSGGGNLKISTSRIEKASRVIP